MLSLGVLVGLSCSVYYKADLHGVWLSLKSPESYNSISFGAFDDFQEFKKIVWALLLIVFFIFLKYHLLVQLRVTISQTLGLLQISREEYNYQRTVQTQEQIERLKNTQHYKLIQNMRGNTYENQNW